MRRAVALTQWVFALGLLVGLWWLDGWLSEDRSAGWERNAVRGAKTRIANRGTAAGVILLGSSTSADWVPAHWLPGIFDESPEDFIDAHVNGCHQGCTWAEVRQLLADGRHFRTALYGTNQMQMCEHEHSKRVLQHRTLSPDGDFWPDFVSYRHSQRPLRRMARYTFGALSGAYADTDAVQRDLGTPILGRWSKRRAMKFVRPHDGRSRRVFCEFTEPQIAYKREVSRRLYADLARLADRTIIILLPDRTLAEDDPEVARAWAQHRQLQRELVAEQPTLHIIDLTTDYEYVDEDFADAIHLARNRWGRQRDRFVTRLRKAELIKKKRSKKKSKQKSKKRSKTR